MSKTIGREIEDDEGLREVMQNARKLAVIGMKRDGAANYVPRYMEQRGYAIIPVNPNFDEIDGKTSLRSVNEAGGADMVVVFRRSETIEDHAREILEMSPLPQSVWLQLGIRNDRASEMLREAGIDVVQSRCLKIEYPRLIG
mgnify:FL=1